MSNLLDDLLKDATSQGLLKSKKKSAASPAQNRTEYTYVPIVDRFRSVSIVLICHVTTCTCCGYEWETPNKPLVKRMNDKGETHYKDTITRDEYVELSRFVEIRSYEAPTCSNCFEENWRADLEEMVNPERLITELLEEVENGYGSDE